MHCFGLIRIRLSILMPIQILNRIRSGYLKLYTSLKSDFVTFIHSSASFFCFIFPIGVTGVILFNIFWTVYWDFLKKAQFIGKFGWYGYRSGSGSAGPGCRIADPALDPAKWYRPDRIRIPIRIHNSVLMLRSTAQKVKNSKYKEVFNDNSHSTL